MITENDWENLRKIYLKKKGIMTNKQILAQLQELLKNISYDSLTAIEVSKLSRSGLSQIISALKVEDED